MSKTLYLECFSGISGDMFVAMLLDLGADLEHLNQGLATLPVDGFQTKVSRVKKSGLDVCDFDVILEKEYENHDHDMEFLHGDLHTYHEHHVERAHHEHHHRGLTEVVEIIETSGIGDRAKKIAKDIFLILGEAEAKAHGVSLEKVHFHEVGAVDSIVDIVSAAICLDNLDIQEVIIPVLYEGRGTIRCSHGILPIPVPAVSRILETHPISIHQTEVEGELITPTGAAIAAAILTNNQLPEKFQIEKVGIGAGKRTYECPGILRGMLIV